MDVSRLSDVRVPSPIGGYGIDMALIIVGGGSPAFFCHFATPRDTSIK
jgi:hypothetical protein